MKKLLKVALVALGVVFMSNFAQAQSKIGYVSIDQIIPLLPEYKTAETVVKAYQQTWLDKLKALETEAQNKNKAYEAKRATMSDADRVVAEGEITDLSRRYQETSNTADQQVRAKGDEQMVPLVAKVKTAVAAVAKEKGYTHVLNATTNDLLLVAPPADDLLPFVKTKLGIK